MAKIYASPLPEPQMDWTKTQDWQATEEKFIAELKEVLLKRNPNGKNVGEVIRFQVADGYAQYMVASMKPCELIYLNLLDGYQETMVQYMNAKAIQGKIDQQKALEKLFSKNK